MTRHGGGDTLVTWLIDWTAEEGIGANDSCGETSVLAKIDSEGRVRKILGKPLRWQNEGYGVYLRS